LIVSIAVRVIWPFIYIIALTAPSKRKKNIPLQSKSMYKQIS